VHQGDLLASTAGRAFWILDDLKPLYEYNSADKEKKLKVFTPEVSIRFGGDQGIPGLPANNALGQNPPAGVSVYYSLKVKDTSDHIAIEIIDGMGKKIREYNSNEKLLSKKASRDTGLNKLVWDFKTESQQLPEGLMVLGGNGGYRIAPGMYKVKITYGNESETKSFEVKDDPRHNISAEQYADQQNILGQLKSSMDDIYDQVKRIRYIKEQVNAFTKRGDSENKEIQDKATLINKQIDSIESRMVQTKSKSFQDVINFENKLDAKMKHVMDLIDGAVPPVTQGQKSRALDLVKDWVNIKQSVNKIVAEDVKSLNDLIEKNKVPFISTERKAEKPVSKS
jgi:hypothetical protein